MGRPNPAAFAKRQREIEKKKKKEEKRAKRAERREAKSADATDDLDADEEQTPADE
jgi:hypothetical protein